MLNEVLAGGLELGVDVLARVDELLLHLGRALEQKLQEGVVGEGKESGSLLQEAKSRRFHLCDKDEAKSDIC